MKTHMAGQPQSKTFPSYTSTQTKDGRHTVKNFFSYAKRTINKIDFTVGTYVSEEKDNKCGKSTKNVKNTNKNNKHSLSLRVFRKHYWGVSFQ